MNAIKAIVIKALLYFCACLPLSWARGLGRIIAWLYWPLGGRSRKVTERNIQLAFPELEGAAQKQLAKRSLSATAELASEMGHVWLRPWEYAAGLIKAVHGADLVSSAQAEGRGVIVLAPHMGNWEMVGLHAGTLGSIISLYEPPKIRALGPLVERSRERAGATLVPTSRRGLAKLLRSVKGGDISGILPDQVPSDIGSGENCLFMGVPCFTPTLANNMIRRTGALAVFCFAERVVGGFVLHYQAAHEDIYDADDAVSLAALNRGVEACVRRCPEQYQWEYKRFRVRPKNGPGLYQDL